MSAETELRVRSAKAPRRVSEAVLVKRILRNLSKLGRVQKWGVELNAHGSARLDVCALVHGELVGIEAKISDWRRAVGQAALNKYAVDRSYIALESARITDDVVILATRHGVGVLAVLPDDLSVVVQAPRLDPHEALRSRLLDRLGTGRRA